jgi:hypothetical protein
VLVCERCQTELLHFYSMCETCAESCVKVGLVYLGRPVYLCVDCGLAHAAKNHLHRVQGQVKMLEDGSTDLSALAGRLASGVEELIAERWRPVSQPPNSSSSSNSEGLEPLSNLVAPPPHALTADTA